MNNPCDEMESRPTSGRELNWEAICMVAFAVILGVLMTIYQSWQENQGEENKATTNTTSSSAQNKKKKATATER